MTTLEITPRWADKTARFKGTVAAGESVSVTVKGAAEWTAGGGLRLRVLGFHGETLAQFPPEVEIEDESAMPEAWGADESNTDATCTLNLRTDRMMRAVPPGATMQFLFVLDDATGDGETLYFKELHEITHWPQRTGEDNPPPYAMRGYRDFVKDVLNRVDAVETQIGNLTLRAERFTEAESGGGRNGVEITIWDGAEGTEPAVVKLYDGEVSLAQMNAAIASAVAGRATTAALDSEAATRAAADAALQAALATLTGADAGYSARQIAAMEVAKVVAGADASFDTLKEIADWITNDTTGAAKMANDISALKSGKVDKVAGKGLSTEDFTSAEKSKLSGIESGANNYTLPAATASSIGGIKVGANLTVAADGTLSAQAGGSSITVDDEMSGTSENPVQNKVVKAALDAKLTRADAEAGFTEWTCTPSTYNGKVISIYKAAEISSVWGIQLDGIDAGAWQGTEDSTSLFWPAGGWDGDVDVTATRTKIRPTKTSELTNDSGFLTSHQSIAGKADKVASATNGNFAALDANGNLTDSGHKHSDYLTAHQELRYGFVTKGFQPALPSDAFPVAYTIESTAYSRSDMSALEFTARNDGTPGFVLSDTEEMIPICLFLSDGTIDSNLKSCTFGGESSTELAFRCVLDDRAVNTIAPASGASFTIAMGALPSGVTGKARDAVLVIDCSLLTEGQEPTVTWGVNFHPRTDAGTDFTCVAGAKNVYYISEYASGEFAVGGWTETAGGNA